MKKVLLTLCAAVVATSVMAQGTISFNNRVTGTIVTHVYLGGTSQMAGNGANDTPSGGMDWAGLTALSGAGYSAALLSGVSVDNLVFQPTSVTTFRTGAAAGFIAPVTVTLSNVPKDAPSAFFQMVAWDNQGGTVTDWRNALVSGASPVFTVAGIGGDLTPTPNPVGLQSFNIYPIPEPSTFALAGLGAAALMIFRRRR